MGILENISAGMGNYTKAERRIAEFIINNVLAFTINPISTIADELGVSKTTLLRFARKMGFEGYFDFRKQLQKEELNRSTTAERFKLLGNNSDMTCIQKLHTIESDNINQFIKGLDRKTFSKCIDSIINANMVYTAGWDNTTFLSELLSYRMKNYGYKFENITTERSSLMNSLIHADKGDLLIVIDMPEYSKFLADAVAFARELGMKIVLITDYVTCPLIKEADMVFYCDSQTDFFKNSLNTPLFFINLLVYSIVCRDDEKIMLYFQKMDNIRKLEQKNILSEEK